MFYCVAAIFLLLSLCDIVSSVHNMNILRKTNLKDIESVTLSTAEGRCISFSHAGCRNGRYLFCVFNRSISPELALLVTIWIFKNTDNLKQKECPSIRLLPLIQGRVAGSAP